MSRRVTGWAWGWAWLLTACALGLLSGQCDVPSGCSAEVVANHPYISNLIDYTDPPSLMVLQSSNFQTLTVYFSEAVDRTSFSLADHVRVKVIEDFWRGETSWRATEVTGFFLPALSWTCDGVLPVCRPGDPEFDPDAATRLELTVDAARREGFTGTLETPYHYLVEILGKCDETPSPDEPCAASPLTSHDDYPLEVPARVFVGVVHDGEISHAIPGPRPTVAGWSPPELVLTPGAYVPPHQKLELYFSDHMGSVNPSTNELEGINFGLFHDDPAHPGVTTLKNESSQGLLPGTQYELLLLSAELAPVLTPGLPPSIDRYGTALGNGSRLEDPAVTQAFVFETAHARILFPWREAASGGTAPWDRQLEEWGYASPVILVEAAPGVTRLSASREGGETSIEFEDVLLDGLGGMVEIPITRVSGNLAPAWRHLLRVHAFAGGAWRGADELEVVHCPWPRPGDPQPPVLEYQLGRSLFVEPGEMGQAVDLDEDMLSDEVETELALKALPFLVLDELEGCFFPDQAPESIWDVVAETQVFFQVRPEGDVGKCWVDDGRRCEQKLVRLTYVLVYQVDCGRDCVNYERHAGDVEPVHLLLGTRDRGVTWELLEAVTDTHGGPTTYDKEWLSARIDWANIQGCVSGFGVDGLPVPDPYKVYKCWDAELDEHLVLFVSRNKHAAYLRKGTCDEATSGGAHCDDCGEGMTLMAPLPADPALAMAYNVGEPRIVVGGGPETENPTKAWDCIGGQGSFGQHGIQDEDLGLLGYEELYREFIWSKLYETMDRDNFCGGMSSQGLACVAEGPSSEACNGPHPTDRNQYHPNCEAAFIEEKLSFEPYCPCSE